VRVKVIFPPFCESAIHGPHLAPPLLSSILNQHNIDSEAIDLNIRLVHRIIENDIIDYVIKVLKQSGENSFEIACLEKVRPDNLKLFCRDSSAGLIKALQIIRKVLFPVPTSFAKCLKGRADRRPDVVYRLYSALIEDIEKYDVIGFSVAFSEQLDETLLLARIARKLFPRCRIILGGSQINLLEESQLDALEQTNIFDAIAAGDGETIIKSIVEESSVNHTTTRLVRSGIIDESGISNLPTPRFADTSAYFPPLSLPILATKGCFWGKCAFCDYVRLSNLGKKRCICRPVDEALREIEFLHKKYSPEEIMLISNAVPPSWYKRLAGEAISRGIELKTWSYMLHSKGLDRSFFKLLSDAGARTINFGTESTDNRILRLMGKNATRDIIFQNILNAKDFHIQIAVNCIIDFPTTGSEEAFAVAHDFRELSPYIDELNPQTFDLTAGAPITYRPEQYNIDFDKNTRIRSSHGYHSISFKHTKTVSTDKNLLKDIYRNLISNERKRKRVESLDHEELREKDILIFDTAIILKGGKYPGLWIITLQLEWLLDDWEYILLKTVLDAYKGNIEVGRLKALFNKTKPDCVEGDFEKYLGYILNSGLIMPE
jgi:biotin synthase-like enzyme